jgi:hypothetical protein
MVSHDSPLTGEHDIASRPALRQAVAELLSAITSRRSRLTSLASPSPT